MADTNGGGGQRFDFSHLQRLTIADKTAWYEAFWLGPTTRIQVRPALPMNLGYQNSILPRMRRIIEGGGDRLTDYRVKAYRAIDREIFPEHVIVGWENLVDAKGQPVPFSVEDARHVIAQVPDELFDHLRGFCQREGNFRDLEAAAELTAKEVAGNSSAGLSGTES